MTECRIVIQHQFTMVSPIRHCGQFMERSIVEVEIGTRDFGKGAKPFMNQRSRFQSGCCFTTTNVMNTGNTQMIEATKRAIGV